MTELCKKNIEKATERTNKLISKFFKDSDDYYKNWKASENPITEKDLIDDDEDDEWLNYVSDDDEPPIYKDQFKLNKNYILKIELGPIWWGEAELSYYIYDTKDNMIDDDIAGKIHRFNHDNNKDIAESLNYLLNMYC